MKNAKYVERSDLHRHRIHENSDPNPRKNFCWSRGHEDLLNENDWSKWSDHSHIQWAEKWSIHPLNSFSFLWFDITLKLLSVSSCRIYALSFHFVSLSMKNTCRFYKEKLSVQREKMRLRKRQFICECSIENSRIAVLIILNTEHSNDLRTLLIRHDHNEWNHITISIYSSITKCIDHLFGRAHIRKTNRLIQARPTKIRKIQIENFIAIRKLDTRTWTSYS